MKKSAFLTIVIIAFAIIFSSCYKEGVYNPKQKISKIYEQSYFGLEKILSPKELSESWTWDGNLLVKIEYGPDGEWYQILEYDGKQISKITNYYNEAIEGYMTYTYEKSILQKIEYFEGSTRTLLAEISHDGKKISKIDITEYYDYIEEENYINKNKTQKENTLKLMHLFISQRNLHAIQKNRHKIMSTNYTINYTYDGDNVIKEEYRYDDGSIETISYTYDDKFSPYYNYMNSECPVNGKNNILTMLQQVYYGGFQDSFSGTFTYEYDGKWPIKDIGEYMSNGSPEFTYIYYYEYLK